MMAYHGTRRRHGAVLVGPRRQETWGLAVGANFSLGGLGAGLYLVASFLAAVFGRPGSSGIAPNWYKLLATGLVGLGFLSLVAEAGRPERARFLLAHLRRSWMSRESLAGALFVTATLLDWAVPHPALWFLATMGALGLVVSHGFILYRAEGVAGWNDVGIPSLFVASALAAGGGLLSVIAAARGEPAPPLYVTTVVCLAISLLTWLSYLGRASRSGGGRVSRRLRRLPIHVAVVGMGHVLPMLLLGVALATMGWVSLALAALAGVLAVLGGAAEKLVLVAGVGYLRPIVIRSAPTVGARENALRDRW